jgi:hypothetical protein
MKITYCLLLAFLLTILVLNSGCVFDNDKYTIRISGTDGLEFTGEYGGTMSGGSQPGDGRDTKKIEGIVPAEYTLVADVVWCHVEKSSKGGTLRVEIFIDNELITGDETTEPYGSIWVEAH